LTKKDGTTVEFVAAVQVDQYAESDEGDHFGRNLSGSRIPGCISRRIARYATDHDIEFLIELLPGTPPISRRSYRMPANELVELKKQIAELLA
jgi:hypothetical protein